MPKSVSLRAEDWRALLRLVGECRDLGDDRLAWRLHLVSELARLTDADAGDCGESGLGGGRQGSLGVAHWGHDHWAPPAAVAEVFARVERDPMLYGTIADYFALLAREDGVCHARTDLIDDRRWYGSTDFQVVQRTYGMDHTLWCFRSLPGGSGAEYHGVVLHRAIGRRDFGARGLVMVREAQAALTPLVGGPLSRFAEPSPHDLAPRARQVLACLLEGDGDKQVAARLGLSAHTVNEHTRAIYRHFGVRSRPELLARWVRRGWASPPAWLD